MSVFQPSPASYGGQSDRDRRIRYAAQQMSGVYKQGAHYGGEPDPWDALGSAVTGITKGIINARAQKNLQKAAYEHEQEMMELQTAAAESEAESQGRLEAIRGKLAGAKLAENLPLVIGIVAVAGVITVVLVTKPWE